MKKILKQDKGISMVSLAVAIVILVIVTNVLLYNAKDSTYIKHLTNMYNDVANLREKVSNYYSIYGEIPAKVKYENTEAIKKIDDSGVIGANDKIDQFYVLELSALEGVTLNFGKDYSIVEELSPITPAEQQEVNELYDIYIINKNSHNIFYVKGIDVKGDKRYYTDDKNIDVEQIDLRYVDGVKIPDGFYYCGGTKDEGIVISDVRGDDLNNSAQGNQFVWVPVENFDQFVREDFGNQNIADTDFINTEPTAAKYYEPESDGEDGGTEVERMYESVKEYDGFYISRFEAGTTATSGTGKRGEVVSKKGANVYNNIGWNDDGTMETEAGGAVAVARNMADANGYTSVRSTLCYGVQWDAVMRWISQDNKLAQYLTDSTGKGNYDTSSIISTGSNDNYQMKNIFDMAGNVWEWTMEAFDTDIRVYRGGSYLINASDGAIAKRGGDSPGSSSVSSIGFRVALYLTGDEWDGASSESPEFKEWNWYIYTPRQLKFLADFVNNGNQLTPQQQEMVTAEGYNPSDITMTDDTMVYLMNDLDLGAREVNGEWETADNEVLNWMPIGKEKDNTLLGTFEGNGYTIKGVYINTDTNFNGIFGNSSTIKNLTIKNSYIKGAGATGGIVGVIRTGTVENCHNINSMCIQIEGNFYTLGGVAGQATNGEEIEILKCTNTGIVIGNGKSSEGRSQVGGVLGTLGQSCVIRECINNGIISSKGSYVGGVVGSMNENAVLDKCANKANVVGEDGYVGGIVGNVSAQSSVADCINMGAVIGNTERVGGIVGSASSNTTMTKCYNTATISGSIAVGGIVGVLAQNENATNSKIENCYNSGQINGQTNIGGILGIIAGNNGQGTVINCYNKGNVTGTTEVGAVIGTQTNTTGLNTLNNLYYLNTVGIGAINGEDDESKNIMSTTDDIKTYEEFLTWIENK